MIWRVALVGMAATGKSTVANEIAKRLKIRAVIASDLLRKLAKKEGFGGNNINWFGTPEGFALLDMRKKNFKIDEDLDNLLIEILDEGNVIMTTRTMPWLYKNHPLISIYLKASLKVRTKRISVRDGISLKQAGEVIQKRDSDYDLYKDIYGIDILNDTSPFQLVINTNNQTPDQTINEVHKFLMSKNA